MVAVASPKESFNQFVREGNALRDLKDTTAADWRSVSSKPGEYSCKGKFGTYTFNLNDNRFSSSVSVGFVGNSRDSVSITPQFGSPLSKKVTELCKEIHTLERERKEAVHGAIKDGSLFTTALEVNVKDLQLSGDHHKTPFASFSATVTAPSGQEVKVSGYLGRFNKSEQPYGLELKAESAIGCCSINVSFTEKDSTAIFATLKKKL